MFEGQKYFKKNLAFIQKSDPSLAFQLNLNDPSELIFCKTQKDELNLKRTYQDQTYYYHSPIHATQEAAEWFQSLDLHLATAIFIYGVGLGYYYQATKEWLKQNRHHALIFLEQDLGVLHRLCETELGVQLFKDPQVKVIYIQNILSDKAIFNELSWTYFESPYVISHLKLYNEVNPIGCLQIDQQLTYFFERKKLFIHEYLQYGMVFFRNFYPNLLQLPQSYLGNSLFGDFPQIPAIICGAGPSLDKNMHLLPDLKERALIFAGGSALNALIPKGIFPHFGVATDPHIYQYSRVVTAQPYQLPFFYRSRLFHEALTAITGKRLYLTGAGGYDTANWFEKELKIDGEDLDEGHNVVNFSIEIAHALGCNPIILIGVDLAFSDQRFYANGIAKGLNVKDEDLKSQYDVIIREDSQGQPIETLWKWVLEAQWISDFAEFHPEITLINATEGGLGIKEIDHLTLAEAAKQYLTKDHEKISDLDHIIQKHPLDSISQEHIVELMEKMQTSLRHCATLCSRLIEQNSALSEQIQKQKQLPSESDLTNLSLFETQIEAEIGYQYLLHIFDKIHIHLHHRESQHLLSPKHRISEKKRALKKLELQRRRLLFLRDVAHFNQTLIQRTIESLL